jgi:hypothetical protein
MDGAVLLDVAAVFNDDFAPIAADCRPGSDVYIFSNDYISGYGCQGMNKELSCMTGL